MSRSGYTDGIDGWGLICWRGAVASAIRGKRGQAFLREMLAALDALPEPGRLRGGKLVYANGEVCAIGSVGVQRGLDLEQIDPFDSDRIAWLFGIAEAMVKEIAWINDEECYTIESAEERFLRVRRWVVSQLGVRDECREGY